MAALKQQRPLIRYAGSAAETSIGSKPIGSELNAGSYPMRHFCQVRFARLKAGSICPPGAKPPHQTLLQQHAIVVMAHEQNRWP